MAADLSAARDGILEDYKILNRINDPRDLRGLTVEELKTLATELRDFLLKTVSQTSGHLASGLGVVELTIALHYVYDTPNDSVIWDVGHQAYPHKILTGRRDSLATIRQKHGLHPFCWREESPYDVFSTGHASTSIGEALGIAIANRVQHNGHHVAAVIGDGALTGGVAFEALNHAGDLGENMLIILNDNEMSISESVGSLAKHLAMWISSPSYARLLKSSKKVLDNVPLIRDFALKAQEHLKGMVVPGTIFEEFGFNYVGPIDGHDLETLISVLRNMRSLDGPQLLHITTTKGKGYTPAELNPSAYHGVPKFNMDTGIQKPKDTKVFTYSDLFGKWLMKTAAQNPKLMGITPAMCTGSGMSEFAQKFPQQYFDVAIAEQHAVLLSSGMAVGGLMPVVSVYSTFLQRAYDQLIHDLAIQKAPVIVAIDRAGVVGPDGPTHQGVFDIGFVRAIPDFIFFAPASIVEMWRMLNTAAKLNAPVAIRYPRGFGKDCNDFTEDDEETIEVGQAQVLRQGKDVCVVGWGPLIKDVERYFAEVNADFTVVNMRSIKPLDLACIKTQALSHKWLITLEDGMISGGVGEAVATYVAKNRLGAGVYNLGIPDEFVEQATCDEIYRAYGMDHESVLALAQKLARQD